MGKMTISEDMKRKMVFMKKGAEAILTAYPDKVNDLDFMVCVSNVLLLTVENMEEKKCTKSTMSRRSTEVFRKPSRKDITQKSTLTD